MKAATEETPGRIRGAHSRRARPRRSLSRRTARRTAIARAADNEEQEDVAEGATGEQLLLYSE